MYGSVCKGGREPHSVALNLSLRGAAHSTGYNEQRAARVVVCARLPLVGEKSFTLKVSVKLFRQLDTHIIQYVGF